MWNNLIPLSNHIIIIFCSLSQITYITQTQTELILSNAYILLSRLKTFKRHTYKHTICGHFRPLKAIKLWPFGIIDTREKCLKGSEKMLEK